MRLFVVVFLIVTIASCSQQQEAYVDPILQPYWQQFQIEAERLGVDLPNKNLVMYVTDDIDYPGHVNGLCRTRKNNVTIEILNKSHIHEGYSQSIEATVFHELAHGFFNRDHNTLYYDNISEDSREFVAVSLMTIGSSRKFWNNGQWREYYLKELFGLIPDYEVYAQQIGYQLIEL